MALVVRSKRQTEAIQCSICLEILADPRSLPCGHVYCGPPRDCLHAMKRGRITKCALCNAEHEGDPHNFVPIYALRELLEEVNETTQLSRCEIHPTETEEYVCQTCQPVTTICKRCWSKWHKNHSVTTLASFEQDLLLQKLNETNYEDDLRRLKIRDQTLEEMQNLIQKHRADLVEKIKAAEDKVNNLPRLRGLANSDDYVPGSEEVSKFLGNGEATRETKEINESNIQRLQQIADELKALLKNFETISELTTHNRRELMRHMVMAKRNLAWNPKEAILVSRAEDEALHAGCSGDDLYSIDEDDNIYKYKLNNGNLTRTQSANWEREHKKYSCSLAVTSRENKPLIYVTCERPDNYPINEVWSIDANTLKPLHKLRTDQLKNGDEAWKIAARDTFVAVYDNSTTMLHVFQHEKWATKYEVGSENVKQIQITENGIVIGDYDTNTVRGYKLIEENGSLAKHLVQVWGPITALRGRFAYDDKNGHLLTRPAFDWMTHQLLATNVTSTDGPRKVKTDGVFLPIASINQPDMFAARDLDNNQLVMLQLK